MCGLWLCLLLRLLVLRSRLIRCRLVRCRLLEVLIDHEGREGQKCEEDQAAKIAAAGAAAAGTLRLEIGITNFWQRVLPVLKEWRTEREPLFLW
jgi:hypothetical protein